MLRNPSKCQLTGKLKRLKWCGAPTTDPQADLMEVETTTNPHCPMCGLAGPQSTNRTPIKDHLNKAWREVLHDNRNGSCPSSTSRPKHCELHQYRIKSTGLTKTL